MLARARCSADPSTSFTRDDARVGASRRRETHARGGFFRPPRARENRALVALDAPHRSRRAVTPRSAFDDASAAADASASSTPSTPSARRAVSQWPPPPGETRDAPVRPGKFLLILGLYAGACYVAMCLGYAFADASTGSGTATLRAAALGALPERAVYVPNDPMAVLKFANMFGTAMYAHAGTITAGSRGMDLMGCVLVGLVTAVAGGTVRQILLGDLPVFWIAAPEYLALAVFSSIATFYLWPLVSRALKLSREMYLVLNLTDALALGCFVVVGANAALARGHGFIVGVICALLTSTMGGVLRDICCAQPIRIMHSEQELYASCVCLGACAFMALAQALPDASIAVRTLVPVGIVALARVLSWSHDLKLPTYADREPFAGRANRLVL